MNIELMKALVGLIQQGGLFALGGVALWGLFQIIKLCLVVYLIKAIVGLTYKAYSNQLSLKLVQRNNSIQLLSDEVSGKLSEDLGNFRESVTQAMESFLKQSENILAPLKKETTKSKEE